MENHDPKKIGQPVPSEVFQTLAETLQKQDTALIRELENKQITLQYIRNATAFAQSAANDLREIERNPTFDFPVTTLAISGQAMLASVSASSLGDSLSAAKLVFDQAAANCSNAVYQAQSISVAAFPQTQTVLQTLKIELKPLVDRLLQLVEPIHHGAFQLALAFKANLATITNPHSLSDAAKNLREMFRVLYYAKAPDGSVEKWSHVEMEKNRPTRSSRLRFSVYRNLDPELYPTAFREHVKVACKAAGDSYSTLSKNVHVSDGTPVPSEKAIPELHEAVSAIVSWIATFQAAVDVRQEIILEPLDLEVSSIVSNDLHHEIEQHYSHAYIDLVEVTELIIHSEDHEASYFSGSGSVSFTGQYGSDGDVRRGDGLETSGHRTFTFSGRYAHGPQPDVELSANDFKLDPEYAPDSDSFEQDEEEV